MLDRTQCTCATVIVDSIVSLGHWDKMNYISTFLPSFLFVFNFSLLLKRLFAFLSICLPSPFLHLCLPVFFHHSVILLPIMMSPTRITAWFFQGRVFGALSPTKHYLSHKNSLKLSLNSLESTFPECKIVTPAVY